MFGFGVLRQKNSRPADGRVGGDKEGDNKPDYQSGLGALAAAPAQGGLAGLEPARERKKKSKEPEVSGPGPVATPGGVEPAGQSGRAPVGLSVNDFISKTKNGQRQGLKPSGPELQAYARYLGIDTVADNDLLWIAIEALEAPLPSEWTEHFDSNDRVFYYNATMRMSSWTHPLEHIYRDTYKTMTDFRNTRRSAQERWEKLQELESGVQQLENDVHKQVSQWTEHMDENNNRFYFNREERQSTWTDPRPAKCQILYLRMKMLRVLKHGMGNNPFEKASVDADDTAQARPKMGAGRDREREREGLGGGGVLPRESGPGATRAHASHAADDLGGPLDRYHQSSPSDLGSERGSDSEEDTSRKHKKKKKKKKKPQKDQAGEAAPPGRQGWGGGAGMRNSQSETSVGGKESQPGRRLQELSGGGGGGDVGALGSLGGAGGGGGGAAEGGGGGLGSFEKPSEASNRKDEQPLEDMKGPSRRRLKAGVRLEPIRLEPIGSTAAGSSPGGRDAGEDQPSRRPQAPEAGHGKVRGSASVPALQP